MRMQTTLAAPCRVSGRGYWSGQANTLTFLPAPADTGIQFVRTDLPGNPTIPALAEYRQPMTLRTRLRKGVASVDMVEHALAALFGLQIDNARILCTNEEIPGLDGSSLAFTLALEEAGSIRLNVRRSTLVVEETVTIGETESICIAPLLPTQKELQVEYQLDYGTDSPIGKSTFSTAVSPKIFAEQVAPARTFISEQDAALIQQQGLATHVTPQDLLVFNERGPVNNSLRYPDECARHKALDVLGDLALVGMDLLGQVTAHKSGHQLNGELALTLRRNAGLLAEPSELNAA